MVRHKGQRTDKQREADHPHAVDIPIPDDGLGQNLNNIIAAANTLAGGAETWGHMTRGERGDPQRWCRTGTKLGADADRLAGLFAHLGARRVR
jgi:hypothetical protein